MFFEDYEVILSSGKKQAPEIEAKLHKSDHMINSWVIEAAAADPSKQRYTFLDLDGDGQSEMLVGSQTAGEELLFYRFVLSQRRSTNPASRGLCSRAWWCS